MATPIPAALVVPRHGPRQWQVDAVKRAEQAGLIRLDAVLESTDGRSVVRDPAVNLLATLESFIDSIRDSGGDGRCTRALRKRCSVRDTWPHIEILSTDERRSSDRRRWPLVINLSPMPGEALQRLATMGVVEFRLGNSHDIDDALDGLRLQRDTIDMSASLVNAFGSYEMARAVACLREQTMIVNSLEVLLARAMTVLSRGIALASRSDAGEAAPRVSMTMRGPLSPRQAAGLLVYALGDYVQTARERLRFGMPIWFLAYRESPDEFVANTFTCSPNGLRVITPPPGRFHADPCVFHHQGVDHVFFEDYDFATGKGVISWMQRSAPGTFTAPEPVLERPHHLSYPFVFAHGGDVYMVPETLEARRIELYRATEFPRRWERAAVLLDDLAAVDATLLEHEGRWWMFASVAEAGSSPSDELFVYYADSLLGPWHPHAANPVKSDVRSARPAGRLFRRDGRLIRPAQNCSRLYGGSLALCEVLELTPSTYRERVIADVPPCWTPRNSRFHTLSFSEGLEFIDGTFSAGVSPLGAA